MSFQIPSRKCLLIPALVASVAMLPCLFADPAKAGSQPYIGWDFGNGVGIGFGPPPSAHESCDAYWPFHPSGCRHSTHSSHRRRHTTTTVHRDLGKPQPQPSHEDTVHRDNGQPPQGPAEADTVHGNDGGSSPGPSDE